ncbi:MAG TPA: polyprenyl diphosphate synthase [Patescibacteria group bacterium]|nr:polyprenyl diphosphate synthase [Patescibacteria group bacterium]
MLQHVAFIMDGNRRWARKRLLPLLAGHTKGYQAIEPLIDHAHKKGIMHLSFWAFSTENWNRDKKEVDVLLHIFRKLFVGDLIKRLHSNGVRVKVLGDITAFPTDIVENLEKVLDLTKNNTAITVNIGLNYGGRAEILRAVNRLIEDKKKNIDEKMFSSYLYTKDQPDPDLIIRTSGEERLSGFLPWQSVYSELYFPDVLWPDFSVKEFDKALEDFEKRKRNFGK